MPRALCCSGSNLVCICRPASGRIVFQLVLGRCLGFVHRRPSLSSGRIVRPASAAYTTTPRRNATYRTRSAKNPTPSACQSLAPRGMVCRRAHRRPLVRKSRRGLPRHRRATRPGAPRGNLGDVSTARKSYCVQYSRYEVQGRHQHVRGSFTCGPWPLSAVRDRL